jgi:hypothetical protein
MSMTIRPGTFRHNSDIGGVRLSSRVYLALEPWQLEAFEEGRAAYLDAGQPRKSRVGRE